MNTVDEEWKVVEGFKGKYKVSNYGRVKSFHRKKEGLILKTTITKLGYERLELNLNGIAKKYAVHRLVACAFLDSIEGKNQVNHIDGNKLNNHVSNLEWCTASENITHSYQSNLNSGRKGIKHHNSKLTKKDVLEIRKCYESGNYKQVELAKIYNLHPNYINLIIKRRRWKHV